MEFRLVWILSVRKVPGGIHLQGRHRGYVIGITVHAHENTFSLILNPRK